MVVPGPGHYKLKTQIIGIKSTESDPFELSTGQVFEYRFEIAASLVVLPAIVVADVHMCQTAGEASLAATTLWEEVRKALSAVAWTEGEALLRHERVRYERELHPRTLQIQDERRSTSAELSRGSPFRTPDAESLVEHGYIQRTDDDEFYYYGPDANVLLSEEFARLHCFRPRPGLEDDALVRFSFEPVMGREVSDIQGTLWIDKHTYELRFLEFNYTQLPVEVECGLIGGRIEFERLQEGPWIVSRWRIRMPVVSYSQTRPITDPDHWTLHELVAIHEVGGWVDEVYTRSGAPVPRVTGVTIVGRVTEQDSYRPIPGVPVVLLGSVLQTCEFRWLSRVYRYGADSIMVLDNGTNRLSVFDSDGNYARLAAADSITGDTIFPLDVWLHGQFWVDGALEPELRGTVKRALSRLTRPNRLGCGCHRSEAQQDLWYGGRFWNAPRMERRDGGLQLIYWTPPLSFQHPGWPRPS